MNVECVSESCKLIRGQSPLLLVNKKTVCSTNKYQIVVDITYGILSYKPVTCDIPINTCLPSRHHPENYRVLSRRCVAQ